MKKIFLFAAAIVAAMTVNAKVINFADIVDNTTADLAASSFNAAFDVANMSVAGKPNGDQTAYYAELTQTEGTTDWETTSMVLKADDQVYFAFKDGSANKLVMKAYKEYVQPNGKAVCMVISGLNSGDKVTINLKKALNKESMIEGATVESDKFESTAVELTAADSEIRVYSKSIDGKNDAKWQIVSVEVPGESQGINNVEAVKAEKFYRDGQLIIRKNGVEYNALGTKL